MQGNFKQVSLRRVVFFAALVIACTVALAAYAGIKLGSHFTDSALRQSALENARDSAEGLYTVERLGELSGKVLRLEQEATTLAQKIGALELFSEQTPPGTKPAKKASIEPTSALPVTNGLGGPHIVARLCAGQGMDEQRDMRAQEAKVACLMKAFADIQTTASQRSITYMQFPARAPIDGVALGSPFGNRSDPITGGLAFHSGLDFAAPTGTEIRAAGGGTVVFAGFRAEMGNMIEIDHGSGLVSRYAHASRLDVRTGDVVTPGQLIAKVGSTGRSTGAHLHFEILRHGQFVNPQHYLSFNLGDTNG